MSVLIETQQSPLRSVYLAIGSGGVARFCGLIANLVALPVTLTHLGQAQFSLFVVVLGLLQIATLSSLGAGKAVTQRAASGTALKDLALDVQATLLVSLVMGLTVASMAGVGLAVAVQRLPYGVLAPGLLFFTLVGSTFFIILLAVLQVWADVQMGLQQLWRINVARASAALFSTGLLVVFLPNLPSLPVAIFAIGSGALAGGILLYATCSPVLRVLILAEKPQSLVARSKHLLREGWPFLAVQGASLLFLCVLPLIVTLAVGAASAVDFSIHARVLVLLWSLGAVVANPMWPALRRLIALQDVAQTRALVLQAGCISALLAFGAGVTFALAGAELIKVWLGRTVPDYEAWALPFGATVIVVLANQFLSQMLMGMGAQRHAAWTNLTFCIAALTASCFCARLAGPHHVFTVIVVCGFLALLRNAWCLRPIQHVQA
ncbi:MAG: lipopolysaccharide biosynthesis protein [Devosiaceae bacterium]